MVSNRSYALFMTAWIAWAFIAVELVDANHWLTAGFITVLFLVATFVAAE